MAKARWPVYINFGVQSWETTYVVPLDIRLDFLCGCSCWVWVSGCFFVSDWLVKWVVKVFLCTEMYSVYAYFLIRYAYLVIIRKKNILLYFTSLSIKSTWQEMQNYFKWLEVGFFTIKVFFKNPISARIIFCLFFFPVFSLGQFLLRQFHLKSVICFCQSAYKTSTFCNY